MSGPAFQLLEEKTKEIANQLSKLEREIYSQETSYFTDDVSSFGNVLKGFDGFLTSKNAQAKNKNRIFRLQDRAFSLSSYTSPATRELHDERDQYNNTNFTRGASRGGGIPTQNYY